MEALMSEFGQQVSELKRCMLLRSNIPLTDDDAAMAMLRKLEGDIATLEKQANEFEAFLTSEETQVERGQTLIQQLDKQHDRLVHMRNNLPDKLPTTQQQQRPGTAIKSANTMAAKLKSSGADKTADQPLQDKQNVPAQTKTSKKTKSASKSAHKQNYDVPPLPYVRVDEFQDVPHYIKGRITRDKVNEAVDAIFEAMKAKYAIMSAPRSKLGQQSMDRWRTYKDQENDETSGQLFVVDADIKELTKFRLDASGRSCLSILRHLGRITEIRSKGLVRYAHACR